MKQTSRHLWMVCFVVLLLVALPHTPNAVEYYPGTQGQYFPTTQERQSLTVPVSVRMEAVRFDRFASSLGASMGWSVTVDPVVGGFKVQGTWESQAWYMILAGIAEEHRLCMVTDPESAEIAIYTCGSVK